MEASAIATSASLRLPVFADPAGGHADLPPEGEAGAPSTSLRMKFETLLSYGRCLREHRSGSIVTVTEWKGAEAGVSARYRCAGCGLLWSPRWRR